jgi:hypothetical protein
MTLDVGRFWYGASWSQGKKILYGVSSRFVIAICGAEARGFVAGEDSGKRASRM